MHQVFLAFSHPSSRPPCRPSSRSPRPSPQPSPHPSPCPSPSQPSSARLTLLSSCSSTLLQLGLHPVSTRVSSVSSGRATRLESRPDCITQTPNRTPNRTPKSCAHRGPDSRPSGRNRRSLPSIRLKSDLIEIRLRRECGYRERRERSAPTRPCLSSMPLVIAHVIPQPWRIGDEHLDVRGWTGDARRVSPSARARSGIATTMPDASP